MIKENIKLKDELTLQEIANFTEELVNACFDEDETGDIKYMPYNMEPAYKMLFFIVCVDGLTFEDEDVILDLIENDDDLRKIDKAYLENMSSTLFLQLSSIQKYAKKMIDFKIQKIVHRSPWELLFKALTDKINSPDFNLDNIADAIVSAYLKSDVFKENRAEVKRARQGNAKSHEKFKEELKQLTKDKIKK